ncbi:transglycosylase SLT domain-containing protein [Methylotuvimicrobium sp. KM2]|uniref:transglycosylase SLT domain-containing protein n=1 Tax=Methylotuvimicrobium sp. KM2 TaxID=3133976 RepID=UPI003101A804
MITKSWVIVLGIGLSIVGSPLHAESMPASYRQIAHEYDIPPRLLYSVALQESRIRLRSRQTRPWPWTLNVAGVPRRYPTRIAAYKGLTFYLERGIRSIDVGLMQVNWRYHQDKLGTPWQALDPYHNVRTGAKILASEYRETEDWFEAIGRYHSPGPGVQQKRRAKKYASSVVGISNNLSK